MTAENLVTSDASSGVADTSMDIHQILEYLPHRYPFVLVDRVIDCQPGKVITTLKNVTINEPYFPGHYPHRPVMPGVLIVEAIAQSAAILSFKTMGSKPDDGSVYYFVGIDGARFKRPVSPGDQLIMQVEITRMSRGIWKYKGVAKVDGAVAAEAELMCTYKSLASPEEA